MLCPRRRYHTPVMGLMGRKVEGLRGKDLDDEIDGSSADGTDAVGFEDGLGTGHAARVVGVFSVDKGSIPSLLLTDNARKAGNDAVHVGGREEIVCREGGCRGRRYDGRRTGGRWFERWLGRTRFGRRGFERRSKSGMMRTAMCGCCCCCCCCCCC